MRRTFRAELRGMGRLVGTLLTTGSPEVAEVVARSGFDWVFIDGEHGSLEGSSVSGVLRAVASAEAASGRECFTVVRVPEIGEVWFKKALDGGCDGVIVPLVNTAEEARRSVAYTKYPPVGERSVGIGRAHGYGMGFKEYMDGANEAVGLIVQVEHIRGVENLDAILDVPGIDGVLIGAYDLSASMGVPGQVHDARVQEAVARVRRRCIERKMPVGRFVMDAEAALAELEAGCRFVAVGTDLGFMADGARRVMERMARVGAAGGHKEPGA